MANYLSAEVKETTRRLYDKGLTNLEMAKLLGVHVETIKHRLKVMGLESRPAKQGNYGGRHKVLTLVPEYCERCSLPDCMWSAIYRECPEARKLKND